MPLSGVKLENLPRSLQDLGEEIGLEAVLKLVARYGGTEISTPKKVHDDHPLVLLVGLPAAQYIASHWGGDNLYIPNLNRVKQKIRNIEIVRRFDQGESTQKLALAFQVTSRTIKNILNMPVAA